MMQDVRDVLASMSGDAGFETFEDSADGMTGYVQQQLFDEAALCSAIDLLPFDAAEVSVGYTVAAAEQRDWNAEWEQQGFEPVSIGTHLYIYDGRHLPHPAPDALTVQIDAKMAFGTGNHATTCMMADALMRLPLENKTVLDSGTGTGVLSIVALLRGAAEAVGYDIDEWSVDNALHNAALNGVENRFKSVLGDSIVIEQLGRTFDVVLANINRNILLADMPRFAKALKPAGGQLLLSGFYEADVPLLVAKAAEYNLSLQEQKSTDGWAFLIFSND